MLVQYRNDTHEVFPAVGTVTVNDIGTLVPATMQLGTHVSETATVGQVFATSGLPIGRPDETFMSLLARVKDASDDDWRLVAYWNEHYEIIEPFIVPTYVEIPGRFEVEGADIALTVNGAIYTPDNVGYAPECNGRAGFVYANFTVPDPAPTKAERRRAFLEQKAERADE